MKLEQLITILFFFLRKAFKFKLLYFVIVVFTGLAYSWWFSSCSDPQKKSGKLCVSDLPPNLTPIVSTSPKHTSPIVFPTAAPTLDLILSKSKNQTVPKKAIDNALLEAEKDFPKDYRFTYERIRLNIEDSERDHHHQAFLLLKEAARKAIENQQSSLMLKQMQQDAVKDTVIQKLAHGHSEWEQVIKALKQQDTNILNK
jgi:type III secretory pathway component EscV